MITITPNEMKALEASYIQEHAVPGALLMEHAAMALCAALRRMAPGGHALFLCGPGNNGGDGYAAARLWRTAGGQATVMALSPAATPDAVMNCTLAQQQGVRVLPAALPLPACDVIVDALFGTGLTRGTEGMAAQLIAAANRSGLPILAADIPSGLNGTTGQALGETILAAETVTFHRLKQGLLLREGPRHAGRITVAPILIPQDYGLQTGFSCLEGTDLPSLIPPRPLDDHKGSFGRVVILAGSEGMAGAAAFCAAAAVKTGAGLTSVICPRAALPIVQMLAPGATCTPLETADIPALLATADAAAIGCGLGRSEALLPALEAFRRASCPVVWDADALNLLASHKALLPLPEHAVITPHPGEAARLLGRTTAAITEDPLSALDALYHTCRCHVLLKGARSLMTDGFRRAANLTGTPALAKGGSGDVLTGMLTALLARRLSCPALTIMQLAAHLHGSAGIRAAAIHGENCVTPMELIENIRLS